jgi:hypothetical protein
MKSNVEIYMLLTRKVEEHKVEMELTRQALEKLKLDKKDLELASKMLLLKDKVNFHKAVVLAYEELIEELK